VAASGKFPAARPRASSTSRIHPSKQMGVTAGEFDALVEDLVASLDHFGVPTAEREELLGLLGPMRGDIVEVESPQTGVPLPGDYQPAPSLK
jgi:hemoglobin